MFSIRYYSPDLVRLLIRRGHLRRTTSETDLRGGRGQPTDTGRTEVGGRHHGEVAVTRGDDPAIAAPRLAGDLPGDSVAVRLIREIVAVEAGVNRGDLGHQEGDLGHHGGHLGHQGEDLGHHEGNLGRQRGDLGRHEGHHQGRDLGHLEGDPSLLYRNLLGKKINFLPVTPKGGKLYLVLHN